MITEKSFIDLLKEMLNTDVDIKLETDLLDIEEWDSFSMINFLALIEEKYNIKIEKADVIDAILVEDLYDALIKSAR